MLFNLPEGKTTPPITLLGKIPPVKKEKGTLANIHVMIDQHEILAFVTLNGWDCVKRDYSFVHSDMMTSMNVNGQLHNCPLMLLLLVLRLRGQDASGKEAHMSKD